jgi:pimeloyl-ACP methyl ester carboxylesterase
MVSIRKRKLLWFVVFVFIAVAGLFVLSSSFKNDKKMSADANISISIRTIAQPLDHSSQDSAEFLQEITVLQPIHAPKDAPVFFILGNESDCTKKSIVKLYRAYGSPEQVIFIQAEHRGYGQSISSDKDQSTPHYLTIDQALVDYHKVITNLKSEFTGPWMAAGYSYGGGLVINFAYRYPEDIKVILASSAVIDWPFYMAAYDRQVKINLGDGLYNRLAYHAANLAPKKLFDQTWLEREFLTNMVIGISQYKKYNSLVPAFKILSYLPTSMFITVLRWMDTHFSDGAGWNTALAFGKKGLSREEAMTGQFNWYTWKYQQCHQTGTHWISENPKGIFRRSKSDILQECRSMFGEDPPAANNPAWSPREMLKELSVPQVFVVGGRDPWKYLCLEHQPNTVTLSYMFEPNGFHCPDKDDPVLGKKVLSEMLKKARDKTKRR